MALQQAGFKTDIWQRTGMARIYLEHKVPVSVYVQVPHYWANKPAQDYLYAGCFVGVEDLNLERKGKGRASAIRPLLHEMRKDVLDRIAHITRREEEIYYA